MPSRRAIIGGLGAVTVAAVARPALATVDFVANFMAGSHELTDDGLAVVQSAADYARVSNIKTLPVTGHADDYRSAKRNLALSRRRTLTVVKRLMELGVKPETIVAAWKGDGQPAVASDNKASDPLNRRVVIDPWYDVDLTARL